MEERPPIWRVVAIILNTQKRNGGQGVSFILSVERGANNSIKCILLPNVHTESLGPGLIIWYELSNEKGHEILFVIRII